MSDIFDSCDSRDTSDSSDSWDSSGNSDKSNKQFCIFSLKNCDKTKKKLKPWQNLKTQIMTKLKNTNCDKTQKT